MKFITRASDPKFQLPAVHLHKHDTEEGQIQSACDH